MRRVSLAVLVLALALAGCKSPTALTAGATGCGVTEVEIVDSAYTRQGATTAWCARCKGKLFQCVSNPEGSRVECRPATSPGPCD
jgi:uncharacterized protein YceK